MKLSPVKNRQHARIAPKKPTGKKRVWKIIPSARVPKKRKGERLEVPRDMQQFHHLCTAIESLMDEAGGKRGLAHDQALQRPFGLSSAQRLNAMNPFAQARWGKCLTQAYEELREGKPFAVSLIDTEWEITVDERHSTNWRALEHIMEDMRARLKKAFRGMSYLFQVDNVIYRDPKAVGKKRRICLHLHGIVFGSAARIANASGLFDGGVSGASGVKSKAIFDAAEWFHYSAKDMRLGRYHYPTKTGRTLRYREQLTPSLLFHLLSLFNGVTKPDLCIAAGRGNAIKKRAVELAKRGGYQIPVAAAIRERPIPTLSWGRYSVDEGLDREYYG